MIDQKKKVNCLQMDITFYFTLIARVEILLEYLDMNRD